MSRTRTLAATVGVTALAALALSAQQPAVTRVYNEATPGIVRPTVVRGEQPAYTRAALEANVVGDAGVEVTVGIDGHVQDVLLVKSVDAVHGLDEAALDTAGRWVFTPATLDGRPVPMRVRLAMSFKLR